MAFTVPQVQLLSSLCIFLLSCQTVAPEERVDLSLFNADSLILRNVNGITYNLHLPFSGKIYQLNPHNDTVMMAAYYNGKEHGEWIRYYDNGQLQELRYFDKGVKTKTLTRWWANGQKQFQCSFANGEYEGPLYEWNEHGQLIREMNYKNGHESGSQKMYYDNGKIRSNYIVKDGRRIGLLGTKNCVNVSDSVFQE